MSLTVEDLTFSYENKIILENLSFTLKTEEIGTLIGASGSGKSTLFKLLTGLLPLHQGQIKIFDKVAPEGYHQIAYMMQQDMLLPWRTVLSNILLVSELGYDHDANETLKNEALELLDEVDLGGCENMFPDELSGGMRQRVSLARALFQKRPLLLLDEPFGALDAGLREQMYRLLRAIKEKHQTTILMITHDFRDALTLSDRLFILEGGSITKEWTIPSINRQDLAYMGQIQQELQGLLVHY